MMDTHVNAMFQQSGVGVSHIDRDGRYLRVNQKLCDILGYSEEELLATTIWNVSFLENSENGRANVERMETGESNGFEMENHFVRRDGEWVWTKITAVTINDSSGLPLYAMCITQDITEWKETQRQLRRGNEQTQIILDALPVAVALIDQEANVQYFNKLAKEWYAVENDDEVVGKHYRDLIPGEIMHGGEILRHWAEKLEPLTFDERVTFRDDKTRDVQMVVIPHIGDKNNLLGAFIMSIDVTGLKKTERKLLALKNKAEVASQAKSDFLATMSHEIRTPMNGVLGMLQLLLAGDLSEADREKADLAHESAHALMDVLNDILDFSRIESGQLKISEAPFDICTTIRKVIDVWTIRAHDKHLDLTFSCPVEMPHTLICDGARIRQILTSLIENAIKFTDKGAISVDVSTTPITVDRLSLRFAVSDTGIGIEREQQDILFEHFNQVQTGFDRKYEGIGLGLAISKSLAELMGGEIGVKSTPGKGSTFWFEIPCDVSTSEREPVHEEPVAAPQNPVAKILIAEDHPVNQQVIMALLATLNAEFITVENGKEAVEAVLANDIDLILIDVRMPVMDGVTATRLIRAMDGAKADVPIIAITANAMRGDKASYIAAGANAYIPKPIDGRELMAAIELVQPKITSSSPNEVSSEPEVQKQALRQA